jgi:hypothetical protein
LTITLFPYYLLKMPSSGPVDPPPPANTVETDTTKTTTSAMGPLAIVGAIIGFIPLFIWHMGAASLSYAKYGSIGWAILDFFFAVFYYPYYALVLNTPTATMVGGRRRMKFF